MMRIKMFNIGKKDGVAFYFPVPIVQWCDALETHCTEHITGHYVSTLHRQGVGDPFPLKMVTLNFSRHFLRIVARFHIDCCQSVTLQVFELDWFEITARLVQFRSGNFDILVEEHRAYIWSSWHSVWRAGFWNFFKSVWARRPYGPI